MPRVGFEPTMTVFERPKTERVLDRAAIGPGCKKKGCDVTRLYTYVQLWRGIKIILINNKYIFLQIKLL
jgi:hypothetical protein